MSSICAMCRMERSEALSAIENLPDLMAAPDGEQTKQNGTGSLTFLKRKSRFAKKHFAA